MATSTKEMIVASWQSIGTIGLVSKRTPVLKPGEVLIRVAASGICGKLYFVYCKKNLTIKERYGSAYS